MKARRLLAIAAATAGLVAAAEPTYARYIVVGAGPGGLQLGHFLDTASRDYLILDKAPQPAAFFRTLPKFRQLISINKPRTGSSSLDHVLRQDWNSLNAELSSSAADARSFNRSRVPCLLRATYDRSAKDNTTGVVASGAPGCWAADYSSTDPAYVAAGVARGLRFSDYSDVYYPHADTLVEYMEHFASGAAARGVVHPSDPPAHRPLRMALGADIVRVSRPEGYDAALKAAS
jgi:hypothetical protein